MKNNIFLLIACLLIGLSSYGQNKNKTDFEKIKALKVAFFTERLSLTSSEAETFWPIYNEYEKNRHLLGKTQYREFYSRINDETLSEKEASNLLTKYLKIEEEEEELDKAFTLNMKKLIGAKKTLALVQAEKDFQKKLIKEYRRKHGGK